MTERKSSIKLSKFFNLSSTSLSSLTHLKNDSKNEKNDKEKDKADTLNLNFQKKMNLLKVDEKLNNLQSSTGTTLNDSNQSSSNLVSSNVSSSNISTNPSNMIGNKTDLMNIDENESLPISSPPMNPSPGNPSQVNLTHISSKNNSSSNIRSRTSSPPMSRSNSMTTTTKPRFRMLDNGLHEHNLRSAKRQEKLSNMLKDLLGAKKLRDEAKSAVPNILGENISPSQSQINLPLPESDKDSSKAKQPPTLFAGLVNHVKNYSPETSSIDQSFVEKYGRCQEVIGKGSYGTVRISHKKLGTSDDDEILYAVKEFKRNANESEKKYNRRLTSEFCISSSLKNINIIDTLDLLKDAKGDYVEVMEFCPGGDLYTLIIASGKLEYAEADCFFKQLIKGVNYMHDMGVSHRDLKPENLLLTQNGILKITDFGNSECFRMAWEQNIQLSQGICGSSPYIAPEEFTDSEFDPRGVDIWSCGVIYMAMRTGRQLWQIAKESDEFFKEYLIKRKNSTGYEPIENLKRARCRNVIYSILDPKPGRRITGKQILSSEWGREIKLCCAAQGK
ncbi:serine/threonine-protein kinase HAL4/SAT4 [[Candida] jaroonii]|uniref:Serine/threonine-protein kinase HAL4/SAT4 n=1 Tax=[Candida] jaroonii TaxID=467808 RepID=A0ACA9YFA5_9ASCO|nr:serine/threonine-protein kinase HAL4/SAT4 [[Candida] jaroonii]